MRLTSTGPEQTRGIGRRIARALGPGDVVLLHGDLGAGKTTLTQGMAAGFGVTTPVQSPTFVLVHEHAGQTDDGRPMTLYHLDLYRLADAEEVEAMGYDDYLSPDDGVTIVEWPERAGSLLPEQCLLVDIRGGGGDERTIVLTAVGTDDAAARWLGSLDGWPESAEPVPVS